MNVHSIYHIFFNHFRTRRMAQFARHFRLTRDTRVLDVGGGWLNWSLLPEQPQLTILNVFPAKEPNVPAEWLVADGCQLPFTDNEFDIVYSNSVIEHLGNIDNQCKFAAECQRVGKNFYIQTPNRQFFIEPHWLALFIHWLPRSTQRRLVRNFTGRGLLTRPTQRDCDALIDEIRLLNYTEMRQLFPTAQIWSEQFAGMTKSFMAVKMNP